MIGEPCNNNKECGSKKSSSKDYCETIYGPSDADGMIEFMLLYFILLSTIVIGFFCFYNNYLSLDFIINKKNNLNINL